MQHMDITEGAGSLDATHGYNRGAGSLDATHGYNRGGLVV